MSLAEIDPARCPSGVYLIESAQWDLVVLGDAFPRRYFLAVVDGKIAGNRESFLAEIARALHFPDYFGHNWDAVYDCLTDLSWLTADGYVLALGGLGNLAQNDPEQWRILLNVLRDACAFWQPPSPPMYALVHDSGEDLAALAFPASCLPTRIEEE